MSHRRFLAFACALGLTGGALTASAGLRVLSPVWIDSEQRLVMGALGDTRATADGVQRISCASARTFGSCSAVDASGRMASCSTQDPDYLAIIRGLSPHSFLIFSWDKTGTCTNLQVQNGSHSISTATAGH